MFIAAPSLVGLATPAAARCSKQNRPGGGWE